MSKLGMCFGLSFLIASGCVAGEAPTDEADETIIGGTHDTGDPAVVALRFTIPATGTAACTATAIAPTVLLTAGHCTSGSVNFQYAQGSTVNPTATTGWVQAAYGVTDPQYDGNSAHGHDVGLVVLSAPINVAAAALGSGPAVHQALRVVGYGLTQPATSGAFGVKNQKSVSALSVATHEFVTGPTDTCHGDSGGPVFNSSGAVVGTVSYGDTADCHGNDHYMRVSDNRSWIDSVVAQVASGGGSSCSSTYIVNGITDTIACSGSSCTCSVGGAVRNTCTATAAQCGTPGNCCGF